VLASALITLAVSPVAMAQEGPADTTTTTTVPTSEAPPATSEAPSSKAEAPTDTDTAAPTKPGEPTKTVTPSTMPTKPAPITGTSAADGLPHEADDYVDDYAYGIDFPEEVYGADGALVIACAAGQPANVFSSDIDLHVKAFEKGPFQDEGDPRYWDFYVKRHPGASFDKQTITVGWDCGGWHIQKPIPPAGGGATGGAPGSQVKVHPKGGVETGGGATARF
jgi:hypothetical protein